MAVYVVNGWSIGEYKYKIGKSTMTMKNLLRRYNTYTGLTNVLYYRKVKFQGQVESQIHANLSEFRIFEKREWFYCPWEVVNYELALMDGRFERECWLSRKIWTGRIDVLRGWWKLIGRRMEDFRSITKTRKKRIRF